MYNLYLRAKEKVGFKKIVEDLNIADGTVKRWEEKKEVPPDYFMDLKRLCEEEVKYEDLTYREKGQFFTAEQTAKECYNLVQEKLFENGYLLEDYCLLEPSAGAGSFIKVFQTEYLAMDIEPREENIIKQDFLTWQPSNEKKYLTIGNPPFGLRGQQALKFLNKALQFSDFCCFILPPLFNSDGRGSPKKRVKGKLLYSGPCSSSYTYPDGSYVKVETIFQIWTSLEDLGEEIEKEIKPVGFSIYSLSDGGTPSTTRNKDKINCCNFYLPSTCFGEENMCLKNSFYDLPQQRGYGIIIENPQLIDKIKNLNWKDIAFISTNGAFNLRRSLIIKAINS